MPTGCHVPRGSYLLWQSTSIAVNSCRTAPGGATSQGRAVRRTSEGQGPMRRSLLIGCAISAALAGSPFARGDAAEDAQKALAEKQAARTKGRAVVVQISAGELEDLKAKVASLQAQVDTLRSQQAR